MFSALENSVLSLINIVPLEWFTFIASVAEEIIPPIPSPGIMAFVGIFAQAQEYTLPALVLLVCIGALGKTLGAYIVYLIADKAENIFSRYFGKYINLAPGDIEKFSKRFSNNRRDYAIFIFLRAIPIVPSTVLSVGSGILKLPVKMIIIGTFVGSLIRNTFYMSVGYIGAEFLVRSVTQSAHIATIIEVAIIIAVLLLIVRMFFKRVSSSGPKG